MCKQFTEPNRTRGIHGINNYRVDDIKIGVLKNRGHYTGTRQIK